MREFSTPMMQQYIKIRQQYSDCMLFFRLGDFYELFLEDALEGAKILGITLTRRPRGKDGDIPMAGVPFHSADTYIAKLLRAGKKIAICEQVSVPDSKGIVDRKVIRIITPGTILDDRSLEQKQHNYLVSVHITKKLIGVALADLLTGDFQVTQFERGAYEREQLGTHLLRFAPSECVVSIDTYNTPELMGLITAYHQPAVSYFADWEKTTKTSEKKLETHFKVASVGSFGFAHLQEAVTAAAVLIEYVNHTQQSTVKHLNRPVLFVPEEYVLLDPATVSNLEIFSTIHGKSADGSLLHVLDKTQTACGGRLLRSWLLNPQKNKQILENRYDVIGTLYSDSESRSNLQIQLSSVLDMERLVSKLSLGIGTIASVLNIKQSLKIFLLLYPILTKHNLKIFQNWRKLPVKVVEKIVSTIHKTVGEEVTETGEVVRVIKAGVHTELDELRSIVTEGELWIKTYEKTERERSGITTLKCRYNSVFGYYIEITQSRLDSIPKNYVRKQTLVNAERFITPELKEHEEKIVAAQTRIAEIEREIFTQLVDDVIFYLEEIKMIANSLAELDVLCNFAQIAQERRYCRPVITADSKIEIIEGKHPVLADKLQENFVPNDVLLTDKEQQLLVITGPNMAGKSVFMRQVALLVLLAQTGSFIPARSATISIVDRIFVRSGASDNISRGLSTFMVEMVEAANILHQATSNSLVIMDEIGRGTSTYDGISIAWAIAEYLVTQPTHRPKVLFATHYHELQELAEKYPKNIKNYQVMVEQHNDAPVFLYTVNSGAASHSFGIAVAKLAGLPDQILKNAQDMLSALESSSAVAQKHTVSENTKNSKLKKNGITTTSCATNKDVLNAVETTVIKKLLEQNLSTTTPLQALTILDELQRTAKK